VKKVTFYFFLLGIISLTLGCTNTFNGFRNIGGAVGNVFKGIAKDSQQNWETLKMWDEKFKEEWW